MASRMHGIGHRRALLLHILNAICAIVSFKMVQTYKICQIGMLPVHIFSVLRTGGFGPPPAIEPLPPLSMGGIYSVNLLIGREMLLTHKCMICQVPLQILSKWQNKNL